MGAIGSNKSLARVRVLVWKLLGVSGQICLLVRNALFAFDESKRLSQPFFDLIEYLFAHGVALAQMLTFVDVEMAPVGVDKCYSRY